MWDEDNERGPTILRQGAKRSNLRGVTSAQCVTRENGARPSRDGFPTQQKPLDHFADELRAVFVETVYVLTLPTFPRPRALSLFAQRWAQ
jgi:hypothetical protein